MEGTERGFTAGKLQIDELESAEFRGAGSEQLGPTPKPTVFLAIHRHPQCGMEEGCLKLVRFLIRCCRSLLCLTPWLWASHVIFLEFLITIVKMKRVRKCSTLQIIKLKETEWLVV